ncbi:UPF0183 domain-containing protein [Phlyctema vagabunda]|uniref:UPF0183 domain-containing protein n=1 Tax=Phlyctema vagabunda TaxID=108571 RepID=A0ABR4P476_9HELO
MTGSPPPLERFASPQSFSSSNTRYSYTSNEAGESSTGASKRSSLVTSTYGTREHERARDGADNSAVKDDRSSRRSHRSRQSTGFLLANSSFERPSRPEPKSSSIENAPRTRASSQEGKGKAKAPSAEKRRLKARSYLGLGIGGSPLASNVTTAANGETAVGDTAVIDHAAASSETQPQNTLDVDSAQIVNLALNLSESRRNAARRHASVPIPPNTNLTEGVAGGSLKQHLQQQRRLSRNVSPKPDRGDRASTASPRLAPGPKLISPLQAAFEASDTSYQYHFSASTLARAQKAKTAIELMAQYRRLLQCVPPLNPNSLERFPTGSSVGTAPESLTAATSQSSRVTSNTYSSSAVGREYNPLQYIRNRKVRARERKIMDGEAQGFGDLEKVTSWVDQISQTPAENRQHLEAPAMTDFAHDTTQGTSPHTSPQAAQGRNRASVTKPKRPRIDWITDPADMIADVFWLEKEENRITIEDRHGKRIFGPGSDLGRPISEQSDKPNVKALEKDTTNRDLRIDTKMLPEFKSVKSDSERDSDHARSSARQRLREATRLHHNGHRRMLSRSRSSSDSSDSDKEVRRHSRRKRSGTADSHAGKDILEKQMLEMLAKEAAENANDLKPDVEGQQIVQSIESQKPKLQQGPEPAGHVRSASRHLQKGHRARDSLMNGSSGRPSLEVPGSNPRSSFDEFDSTAPSSPEIRASQIANGFIPSISMDLSPATSRNGSPTRNPLKRVRSKINNLQRDRSRERADDEVVVPRVSLDVPGRHEFPATPDNPKRSRSPVKSLITRKTDDSQHLIRSRTGSMKGKADEASGIRGLFKSGRGAVSKVGDVFWKKESSPGAAVSSAVSSDDSDAEERNGNAIEKDETQDKSPIPNGAEFLSKKERQSFLQNMPTFTSPFEKRGRERLVKHETTETDEDVTISHQQTREEGGRNSRFEGPPRIDVQGASPGPSTKLGGRLRIGSENFNAEPFRNGYSGVADADARLNAILGLPGKGRDQLPVTGLSKLETSMDHRPSLEGRRQWSISDRGVSTHRGPMTKREIARVRALLLSSGIKAKEIARRAAEVQDLTHPKQVRFAEIVALSKDRVGPTPKSQEHIIAAGILSNDIHLSTRVWQSTAENFSEKTVHDLLSQVGTLQARVVDNLTPMARKSADEADEVSKDLVTSHTLDVKRLTDRMDTMLRRRRRRFRWLRRGGWVLLEWALVGIMWYVWFMVMLARIVLGVFGAGFGFVRWLFWL